MKIKEYRVFVVENPPPHYGGAYWTFVKLITDSKIEGIGEVYSLPFHPKVVEKMIPTSVNGTSLVTIHSK